MPEPDLVDLFVAPLEQAGIDTYMVSGSVAAIEYGEPRATLDIDLALLLPATKAGFLAQIFNPPTYYCPPEEIIALELARPARGHFNLIHVDSGLKADIYPSQNHPLLPWAIRNRRKVRIGDHLVWLAPPEYVILWKLEFFREGGGEKHLRDVHGMLEVSGTEIDQKFLAKWTTKLGLAETWPPP